MRANLADIDMQMVRSAISRSATFDETNLRSETFYNLSGTKGEERAWYSYNYRTGGKIIKDTTIYTYEALTGADARENERMTESNTFDGKVQDIDINAP